jgi:hypothetical protein
MTADLDQLTREELILRARELGAERPEVMTRVELRDEIVRLSEPDPLLRRRSRGWLGVARDLVASVVDAGLNMPGAAAAIRGDARPAEETTGPPPVATLTLAEIYLAQGHVERALAVLEELLATEPEHALALALRDRIHRDRERGAFRRRSALDPEEHTSERLSSPAPAPFTPSSPAPAPFTPSSPPDAMRVPPRMSDVAEPPETVPSGQEFVAPGDAVPSPSLDAIATPMPEAVRAPAVEGATNASALEGATAATAEVPPPPLPEVFPPPLPEVEAASLDAVTPAPEAVAVPPLDAGAAEPFSEPAHEEVGAEALPVATEAHPVVEAAVVEELRAGDSVLELAGVASPDATPPAAPVVPAAAPAFDLTTEAEPAPHPAPHFPAEFKTEPGVPPARTSAPFESTPPSAPTPTLAAPSPRTLAVEPASGSVCVLVQKGSEIEVHYRVPVGAHGLLLRVAWFVPGRRGPTEGNLDLSLDPAAVRVTLPPVEASAHVRGALGIELEGAFKPFAIAWVYRVSESGVSVAFAPPGAPPVALRAQLGRELADLLV